MFSYKVWAPDFWGVNDVCVVLVRVCDSEALWWILTSFYIFDR